MEEAHPPTKKLCSCGADLSSLSVYHVRKHLAGSNHLKVQAASGLREPTSIKRTLVVQRPCACRAEIEVARGPGGDREAVLTHKRLESQISTPSTFLPKGRNNQPTNQSGIASGNLAVAPCTALHEYRISAIKHRTRLVAALE